jgi:hypothetical protein
LKLLKYLAIALIVLAIIAAVLNYKRETIAREIANNALRGQGLVATDLSIDALGTDRILLSQLVLLGDNGTRYDLRDVSFPLNFPSALGNSISIGELLLTPANAPDEPLALSQILQSFLALPESLPKTELTLSRFSMQDVPQLQDVVWRSATDSQQLSFSVDAIAVTAEFSPQRDGLHRVQLRASTLEAGQVLSLTLSIRRLQDGFSIDGSMAVQLEPWLPLLQTLGVLPQELVVLDAGMTGSVSANLLDAADVPAGLQSDLTVDETLGATYAVSADSAIEVRSAGQDRVLLQLAYPSLEWTTEVPQSKLRVNAAGFTDVPVSLSQLSCRSGVLCGMHASGDEYPMAIGDTRIGNLQFAGNLEVLSAEETRVTFSPDFKLRLDNVESTAVTVTSLGVSFSSGATVQLDKSGWRANSEKLEVLLDSASNRDTLLATLPVTLTALRIDNQSQYMESRFDIAAGSASIRWNGIALVAPGATGNLQLDDGVATTSFELSDTEGALSAHVDGRYEIAAARGTLSFRDARLLFDQQPLSARLLEWPHPWDLVSGAWTGAMQIDFAATNDGWN